MDREEIKESRKLESLQGFTEILKTISKGPIKGMKVIRVPILEEKALPEECFDIIVKCLVNENPARTQCINKLVSGAETKLLKSFNHKQTTFILLRNPRNSEPASPNSDSRGNL